MESSDSIRSSFVEHGFYRARGVFDRETVEELEVDFDRIVAQLERSGERINARWRSASERLDAADSVVFHTHQVQKYSARWMRALQDERFLDRVEAVLGPDIVLHHTKLFAKPPRIGAPFPLHQDWAYFPTERDSMIAAVIHVSAADEESGCLRVVPGSHRLGRRPGLSGSDTHGPQDLEFLARFDLEKADPIACEPGDVVLLHYFTLHGSGRNQSERMRKTVLVQLYAGDDAVEAGNEHADSRLALRGWNHRSSRSRAGTP